MRQFISNSSFETKQIAAALAKQITKGVIALSGDLGTGKTTFVQGFAKGLGIKEKIISPTFVLIRQHKIPNTNSALYHIDLYRLREKSPPDPSSRSQIESFGLEEIISSPSNLVLIEWAEKIEHYLPNNTTKIFMKKMGDKSRLITIE